MFVIKRDGREEPVHFDKITARINKLAYGLNQEFCDPVRLRENQMTEPGSGATDATPRRVARRVSRERERREYTRGTNARAVHSRRSRMRARARRATLVP